jgi:DNA-binding NtrC family response regulator
MALEDAGAKVTSTNTVKHAKLLAEHYGLAAAIIDHSLGDGDSTDLRARLKERGIPFVVYSGFGGAFIGSVA